METYRSGWIAKNTGLPRKTMEDYVRRGYIHPRQSHTSNNYREYTARDIERAWAIKQLITIGYSHAEIAEMIRTPDGLDVKQTIHEKIRRLEERKGKIEKLIQYARRIEANGAVPPCPALEQGTVPCSGKQVGTGDGSVFQNEQAITKSKGQTE